MREPIPYIGNSPCFGRVTLGLVRCLLSQMMPQEQAGTQQWKVTKHMCVHLAVKPDASAIL